ncbi:MAG TPA: hypothetical protein PLB45_04045 [Bacilli bacterium]|nr:hypothetical protein [Bacilli bacterium]
MDLDERKRVNGVKYDELTRRRALLVSAFPIEQQRPESISKEINDISLMQSYLSDGISGRISGSNLRGGVYVDAFENEKFDNILNELQSLQSVNASLIPAESVHSFEMPTVDISKQLEMIKNANTMQEVFSIRASILPSIQLCTQEQQMAFSKQVSEAVRLAQTNIDSRAQANAQSADNRAKSIQSAKDRYNKLSIFGKLKANMQGYGIKNVESFSDDQLDSMYNSGRGR